MIAEIASVEAKGSLVVDSRGANEGNGYQGSGANPWHLDAQTESILFVTDIGNKPARVIGKVVANGVPASWASSP
jgi:hypothetical protein